MRKSVPLLGAFLLAGAAAALEAAEAAASRAKATPHPDVIDDLVAANRILSDQGVVDGFGHVSVRHDTDPTRFLLARSMAPGLVSANDILEFDLDGNAFEPRGRTLYVERFIHSEIYKAHPDIKAVVHSHSPSIIPFGATDVPLRPIYHMSSFLGAGVPVFEIREAGGAATDMLIRDPVFGAAVARKLGRSAVVLMRGHGNVVVGQSIEQVVFRAIYTEINAKLQADALRLGQGEVAFLNAEEAANATATNNLVLSRAWELWKQQAFRPR